MKPWTAREGSLRRLKTDLEIPAPLAERLEAASRPELVHPYHFFEEAFFTGGMFTGGTTVRSEPTWFRPSPGRQPCP